MRADVGTSQDPVLEREKLLAARGWEADRERTGVLRELLGRSVQNVYLWSFSRLRSRDRALEVTRNTLLWASRSIGRVPEGRLLDHWIFEHLATETPVRLDLRRSELGPEPCLVLGEDANLHYLSAYPACEALRAAYEEYRRIGEDAQLVTRAGWGTAAEDLTRFLEGHFGDENAQPSEVRDPILHRLGRVGLRKVFPLLLVAGLAAYTVWLRQENAELRAALESASTAAPRETVAAQDPAPERLNGLALSVGEDALTFTWEAFAGADSYRLVICNAKMDTLFVRPNIRTARTMVRVADVPGFTPEGSYVFKVEGFKGAGIVARSPMVPHPPI